MDSKNQNLKFKKFLNINLFMRLKPREQLWCFLFRFKLLRFFIFYKLERYKTNYLT